MLKRDELSNPNSCLNKAADDELVFVLLARDVAAPNIVRIWVNDRICRGKNKREDPQITEALEWADQAEAFQLLKGLPGEWKVMPKLVDGKHVGFCLEYVVIQDTARLAVYATLDQAKEALEKIESCPTNS